MRNREGSTNMESRGGSIIKNLLPRGIATQRSSDHHSFIRLIIMKRSFSTGLFAILLGAGSLFSQDYEPITGAVIYDYDPATKVGDEVFGTVICDFENDDPGRNSHGGPVCMEFADGTIVAFHTNTSGHNIDGWSEYAVSKDKGKTWKRNHPFQYSRDAYRNDPNRPAWVEEGLVTEKGTGVLFVTHFEDGARSRSVFMRSHDHGATWTDAEAVDGSFIGYPTSVAVVGDSNYVLFDQAGSGNLHVLYVSEDDGVSWQRRSVLPLQKEKWYGAMCAMTDGALLAGAYDNHDEMSFFYCISRDNGRTWTERRAARVAKKIRDPELACLGGRYYLHGRAGHSGKGAHRFVLYQSADGEHWDDGLIISSRAKGPDGYSHNCIINRFDNESPNELMVEYSILYADRNTNEYVFFIKPDAR